MAEPKKHLLSYLSEEDVHHIDRASRRVLSEVGIKMGDESFIARLKDRGCTHKKGRIQIPSELVDEALKVLPGQVTFMGRDKNLLETGTGRTATHTGGSIPYVNDPDTGKKRKASLSDLENMIRLMNHLDNLSMVGAVVQPQELPPEISELIQMATVFRLAKKPSSGQAVSTAAQARYVAELYQALMGSVDNPNHYPLTNIGISPESPLYYPKEVTGIMEALISRGIPTLALVAPILGFTAPMTIAGGLTQMNASLLAYCVLSHDINPSVPVFYGARLCPANMSNGHSIWGVPEIGIMGACSVQLARHYNLPSDVYGYMSTSCVHDMQLGAETAVNGLLPFLSGADIISGFGSFGSGFISSFEDLVFDDELFAMHRRISQGIKVDPDHLAVEVIAEAMDGKEYFLSPHTVKHLRTGELFRPRVGLYGLPKKWEEEGGLDMAAKCRKRVTEVLDQNEDLPLPEDVSKEFEKILDCAKKELC
ncbi:trimethylamine methyltransferase family protein [Desulfospira joergensenii]|uniref:trimethylamine methyltransferase family protein n=1 Tax=Desulfospira joergensenii TaxID=53329 RepID=UPI0003B2EB1F|nr:trimethylamine methyltransferase family protein [Desulfospira joergensenii]